MAFTTVGTKLRFVQLALRSNFPEFKIRIGTWIQGPGKSEFWMQHWNNSINMCAVLSHCAVLPWLIFNQPLLSTGVQRRTSDPVERGVSITRYYPKFNTGVPVSNVGRHFISPLRLHPRAPSLYQPASYISQ